MQIHFNVFRNYLLLYIKVSELNTYKFSNDSEEGVKLQLTEKARVSTSTTTI